MERYLIAGIQVHSADISEINDFILKACETENKSVILSGNIHSFNMANQMPWLKEFLNGADLVRCDGAGIVLGGKLLGHTLKKRITWADYAWELAKFCETQKLSLYLLGNKQGVAKLAADKLREKFPLLNIRGIHHGYFKKTGQDSMEIIEKVNESRPDILLLGLGMPVQEKWLKENLASLNVKVAMTCGAAFEFISGTTKRCPQWVGELGFEWLYRFILEPRRMFKRYIIGNFAFLWRVLLSKASAS